MSKRIYPVKAKDGKLVEVDEKLTVNGLPIAKDGTIDSSYVSGGGDSEWEVDANGNLVPIDGEPVDVASLSTDEQSITNLGARIYATTNQTISGSTFTKVAFDTTDVDDESEVDLTNNKITVADAGRYLVTGRTTYGSPPDATRIIGEVRVNGTATDRSNIGASGANLNTTTEVVTVLELNGGDDVEFYTWQNSGGSLDTAGGEKTTNLTVTHLG